MIGRGGKRRSFNTAVAADVDGCEARPALITPGALKS